MQAADAISGGRPGARRESIEAYVQRLERLEEIAGAHAGVDKVFAMQAGREIRVMVPPEQVDDIAAQVMARDIAKQIEEELPTRVRSGSRGPGVSGHRDRAVSLDTSRPHPGVGGDTGVGLDAGVGLDVERIRAEFPALADANAHFDAPGGTQTPRAVIDAIAAALAGPLANRGTDTPAARNAEEIVVASRLAVADLVAGIRVGLSSAAARPS